MDENLRAMHQIQSEDAQQEAQPQQVAGGQQGPAAEPTQQATNGGLLGAVVPWARAACAGLAGLVAHLESSFFNFCRRGEGQSSELPCIHAFALCVMQHPGPDSPLTCPRPLTCRRPTCVCVRVQSWMPHPPTRAACASSRRWPPAPCCVPRSCASTPRYLVRRAARLDSLCTAPA